VKVIKKKLDVSHFIVNFSDVADGYDEVNEKYYLTEDDPLLEGTITFILYPFEARITYHRVNNLFCDWNEIDIDNDVVWGYRKLLNKKFRSLRMDR
jgi:hypothetical protein